MPLLFEDDFCLQKEIEICDTYLPIDSEIEQETQEKIRININEKIEAVETSKVNTKDKIIITSAVNFGTKENIKIDLKNMKKMALTDKINRNSKARNRNHYLKDEEILQDLMDYNIN
ncbi:unnamed protein product [Parnassius apollo]|uniref:(apollo) hypothetical protein n=1 Tax=Parnassius apollo TaxID=110799 RepID=A0A8S3XPF7_PARAO|nr:unnamed protein product [Parnassius apollo]